MHLGNALAPSYKQFLRLGQASFGTPDKKGEVLNIGPELAGFMGFRSIKVDPIRAMGFKISQYQGGIRNSRREFTGGVFGLLKGGSVNEADVIERYIASNRARFEVQKDMFKNIEAAQTLGETPALLGRTFKERQVSSKSFGFLIQGRFEPYFPSKDILRKFREIAAGIDESDPFAAVAPDVRELQQGFRELNLGDRFQGFATGGKVNSQPVSNGIDSVIPALVDIRSQLEQLDLDEEFNVDISDYIPEEQNPITASVPPTPMPIANKSQVMPQQALNTNLTRNEEALLSPMEKEIAKTS